MKVSNPVLPVEIPHQSRVLQLFSRTYLADAYEAPLPEGAIHDPPALARFIFGNQPSWVSKLMRMRDLVAARFGLKTANRLRKSGDQRIGIFKIYETHPTEVILGEDDAHLDFRVSVLVRSKPLAGSSENFVVVSTVVHCHNLLGRCYIFFIAPFHRLVVKAGLRRAASLGWPLTQSPPLPRNPVVQ